MFLPKSASPATMFGCSPDGCCIFFRGERLHLTGEHTGQLKAKDDRDLFSEMIKTALHRAHASQSEGFVQREGGYSKHRDGKRCAVNLDNDFFFDDDEEDAECRGNGYGNDVGGDAGVDGHGEGDNDNSNSVEDEDSIDDNDDNDDNDVGDDYWDDVVDDEGDCDDDDDNDAEE